MSVGEHVNRNVTGITASAATLTFTQSSLAANGGNKESLASAAPIVAKLQRDVKFEPLTNQMRFSFTTIALCVAVEL